jgi:hypothetical protein
MTVIKELIVFENERHYNKQKNKEEGCQAYNNYNRRNIKK